MPDPIAPRKRGRPPKPIITLDYGKIADLASSGWENKRIAADIGLSEDQFSRRLGWDPRLQDALDKKDAPIDYTYVNYLARENCTQEEIARKIHMSPAQFSTRKNEDVDLVNALVSGWNDFNVELRHAKKQSWKPQYSTLCRACGYIMDGMESYKEEDEEGNTVVKVRLPLTCKKCGEAGLKYDKTPASVGAQIWESKQHLGETDKVELAGKKDAPIKFQWLKENDPGAGDKRKAGKV
jgi:hypothetical protein